ncbi:TerB family tellurite resistance protein [Ectothiorhodospira sp. BSL-9]|uniref:TerB family tellurite resistance protein n=1 Tax=Ectothiorhodospira sp. BSL-9 TaxID=1442136 RepID=UPI0007B4233C|nr:TerB family tellurite resistance protein [Ectothiorhodospira sp. BSL-9]ANB03019.1 hypothetical protein ECTOBSL9_2568 [Ectothiorhodospira sp. BSL-9]
MYLSLLKSRDSKILFLKYAVLVSFVDVLTDEDEGVEFEARYGSHFYLSDGHFHDEIVSFAQNNVESIHKTLKSFIATGVELKTLKMFCDEMGMEAFLDRDPWYSELDRKVDELLAQFLFGTAALIQKTGQTTNPDLLREQKIRQSFLIKSCEAFAEYNEEIIDNLSPEERKVMIFELLGMAYSDGVVSIQEKEVVIEISSLLGVEHSFIEDVTEVIEEVSRLHKKGLELIEE